ncbi:hypothetical protein QA601_17910 [Chitinispirillales bacterium ANBcel5]|uniref:hypothetical protein n=1 Tax=Cellulosispirillum alkaliphilum TaxID=3039283 RepID=UPI002A510CE1|nr:hypothetical protein [Chitinispirillales bacterium ANBcel5]
MKKIIAAGFVSVFVLLFSCGITNNKDTGETTLTVDFGHDRTEIGLIMPDDIGEDLDFSEVEVEVNFAASLSNKFDAKAFFDSATFYLRLEDIEESAPAITAQISNFTLPELTDTTITIPFRISIDDPTFPKAAISKILKGEPVAYRVTADLLFDLIEGVEGDFEVIESKVSQFDLQTERITTAPNLAALGIVGELLLRHLDRF